MSPQTPLFKQCLVRTPSVQSVLYRVSSRVLLKIQGPPPSWWRVSNSSLSHTPVISGVFHYSCVDISGTTKLVEEAYNYFIRRNEKLVIRLTVDGQVDAGIRVGRRRKL